MVLCDHVHTCSCMQCGSVSVKCECATSQTFCSLLRATFVASFFVVSQGVRERLQVEGFSAIHHLSAFLFGRQKRISQCQPASPNSFTLCLLATSFLPWPANNDRSPNSRASRYRHMSAANVTLQYCTTLQCPNRTGVGLNS